METFTLDTSGFVPHSYQWSDLSPFEQGYVEAMFASEYRGARLGDAKGFSDLAPETLAAILRDCEIFRSGYGLPESYMANQKASKRGGEMWHSRQTGGFDILPPLTPYLDDTGKVRLREGVSA